MEHSIQETIGCVSQLGKQGVAGHMGSQDGKRHSGSQAEVSELWFS